MEWYAEIVQGHASDLAGFLNRFEQDGWTIRFMLPNGVDRWTVVMNRST